MENEKHRTDGTQCWCNPDIIRFYHCFRCRKQFETKNNELDTDKPTCTPCFKEVIGAKTVEEYKEKMKLV